MLKIRNSDGGVQISVFDPYTGTYAMDCLFDYREAVLFLRGWFSIKDRQDTAVFFI